MMETNNNKTYYPKYDRSEIGFPGLPKQIKLSTTMRKKKGRIWREFDVVASFLVDLYTDAEMIDLFHKNCYTYLVSMEIPKLGQIVGERIPFQPWTKGDMFPKSEIQISEKERLKLI